MENAGIPPGWTYNPAAWSQRLPIVGLALIGLGLATYLSLFQLKVISSVWDPFFGDGSRRVLTSEISRALPVPDAVLGALGYLADVVAGVIGGIRRWRTMPWIVVVFGIFVGPLGMTSVLLVILQPIAVGDWCTICMVTAAISIVMIGPALDEMLASLQYLRRVKDARLSVWAAFWGYASIQGKVQ